MIPAGYMAKFVEDRPDWLAATGVSDIYSVSGCVSRCFADYHDEWKHNGFGLFDSIDIVEQVARRKAVGLEGAKFFYYEVYEREFDEDGNEDLVPAPESPVIDVRVPEERTLEGFDVITFSTGYYPECSPLSCNGLASEHEVNRHCLLASLEEAIALLKSGAFKDSEPGPYRIFAVYSV